MLWSITHVSMFLISFNLPLSAGSPPLQLWRQGSWSCLFQTDVPPGSTSSWHAAGHLASKSALPSLKSYMPWESCPLTAKSESTMGNPDQPPSPKIKTGMLDYESHSFQGRGLRREKNTFLICISNGVWTRLLCYISGNALMFVWMASCEQCQGLTFALTAAWTTPHPPLSPSLCFRCDPAYLSVAALSQRHLVSQSLTTSVPLPLCTHAHPDLRGLCRDVRSSAFTCTDQ